MSLADQIIESKIKFLNQENQVLEEIKKQLEDKFFDASNERSNLIKSKRLYSTMNSEADDIIKSLTSRDLPNSALLCNER